jgi:hypothetical protein
MPPSNFRWHTTTSMAIVTVSHFWFHFLESSSMTIAELPELAHAVALPSALSRVVRRSVSALALSCVPIYRSTAHAVTFLLHHLRPKAFIIVSPKHPLNRSLPRFIERSQPQLHCGYRSITPDIPAARPQRYSRRCLVQPPVSYPHLQWRPRRLLATSAAPKTSALLALTARRRPRPVQTHRRLKSAPKFRRTLFRLHPLQ